MEFKEILANEEMTAEEKLEALKGIEFPNVSEMVAKSEYEKLKSATDKASHEASEWKKKYNATLDENQKKEVEEKERSEELQKELESLRKENAVSKYSKKYLALGYEEDLANKAAKALYEGDMDKIFDIQKSVMEAKVSEVTAEVARQTPPPLGSSGTTPTMTKEALSKMTQAERMKFANENPEEYRQIYEGGN